jgi:hypothetical protein
MIQERDNMKIEAIMEEWEKDSDIDKTELGDAALKLAKLHHKYYRFLVNEKMILKTYEADMHSLKLDKYEFFTQGPNEETMKKSWVLPAKGLILKADIPMYMSADKDIINLSLKIGLQEEKIQALESIIRTLNSMGYNIKAAIDWQKFINGM